MKQNFAAKGRFGSVMLLPLPLFQPIGRKA